MRAFLLLALIAVASAFAPLRPAARVNAMSALRMGSANPGPTYWETAAPPSSVLGVGEKIPSSLFGPLSLVALVAGTYCVHESNIFHQLSQTSVNPEYIIGSLLVPISWGMHVAAWIQKKNGK